MLALSAGLVCLLGSPDWEVREAAELALRRAGPAALPAVCRGLADESPEVRVRCGRLAAPVRLAAERRRVRAAALWALDSPFPPNYAVVCDLYVDYPVREEIIRELGRRGCPVADHTYRYLSPAVTDQLSAWHGYYLGFSLEAARNAYGTPRLWWLPVW